MSAALVAAISGCSVAPTAPPTPVDTATRPSAPTSGEVLGQSERFIVYQAGPDDTLKTIAARFLGSDERDWVIGDFNATSRVEPGQVLAVPLKTLNAGGVWPDHYQTVPILCYHRFAPTASKMAVSVANFGRQLEWLAANGYHVIRLSQLLGFLEGKEALPRKSVVITIDDGYESVHRHALPLLRKHGFPATLFVYTDFIGAGDALSWSQLQELAASGLIDVQSHSKTHRNLIERTAGDTDAQYRQELEAETKAPRELIERRLPVKVRHYAYPYGDANDVVLDVLARQHYQLAVTVNPGGNAFFAQPLMLRRTMIFGDHDLEAFKARLQTSRAIDVP